MHRDLGFEKHIMKNDIVKKFLLAMFWARFYGFFEKRRCTGASRLSKTNTSVARMEHSWVETSSCFHDFANFEKPLMLRTPTDNYCVYYNTMLIRLRGALSFKKNTWRRNPFVCKSRSPGRRSTCRALDVCFIHLLCT